MKKDNNYVTTSKKSDIKIRQSSGSQKSDASLNKYKS